MAIIRDFKKESNKYLDRFKEILIPLKLNERASAIENEVSKLMNRYNPSIMFYGVYNAGKSSLVNAIFGEYIAEVGDIPTTCDVTEHLHDGYVIVDTPGINGPDEHWTISENELKKHDVILFVVDDSDTFDSGLVAKEIVRIVEFRKPLIVVMNIKNSFSEEEKTRKHQKLISNVNFVSNSKGITGIERKFDFVDVEVKPAYEAKVAQDKYLNYTGLNELESILSKVIKGIDEAKMLTVPLDILIKEGNILINEITNQIDKLDDRKYIEKMAELEDLKKISFINISHIVRREINIISEKIFVLCSNDQNPETEISAFQNRLEGLIKGELDRIGHQIDISIRDKSHMNFTTIEKENYKTMGIEYDSKDKSDDIDILGDILPIVVKPSIPIITPPLPIPIPPNLFPLVVTTLYKILKDFFDGDNKEDNEELIRKVQQQNAKNIEIANRRMTAIIEMNSKIRAEMYKLEEDYLNDIKGKIFEYFDTIIQKIEKELDEMSDKDRKHKETIGELKTLLNELEILRNEL